MPNINRREFLGLSAKLAALMGLGSPAVPKIAHALESLASDTPPVLWLQAQSCSGCSVSMLNSESPGLAELLTRHISLVFHATLSAATGEMAMDIVHRIMENSRESGGYLLAVEGSIPEKMPNVCMMGEESMNDLISRAAKPAKAVIAVGTCASFGGIPGAENNPTGAVSLPVFLKNRGIAKTLITVPGCPAHSEWIVGTFAYLLKFGIPPRDKNGRPDMFFSRLVHDQCPRFADYERENFAATFSENGCLFKLGCLGPNTHADCTIRYWNSRTSSCITAGGPCIGCASEEFARKASFPFYRKGEEVGG